MKKVLIGLVMLAISLPSFAYDARSSLVQAYQQEQGYVKTEMVKIFLNYPGATVAWVAASGGLASMFTDTLTQNQKTALALGGLFAGAYCLSAQHQDECTYVFLNMTKGAYLLSDYEQKIEALN